MMSHDIYGDPTIRQTVITFGTVSTAVSLSWNDPSCNHVRTYDYAYNQRQKLIGG